MCCKNWLLLTALEPLSNFSGLGTSDQLRLQRLLGDRPHCKLITVASASELDITHVSVAVCEGCHAMMCGVRSRYRLLSRSKTPLDCVTRLIHLIHLIQPHSTPHIPWCATGL